MHAINDLRQAFETALEDCTFRGGKAGKLFAASKRLVGCTDILPRSSRELVVEHVDEGTDVSTYGSASKALLKGLA